MNTVTLTEDALRTLLREAIQEALALVRQPAAIDKTFATLLMSAAAIRFALEAEDGMYWLSAWLHGRFDVCRAAWPEAPEACYVGAPFVPIGGKAA